MNLLQKMKEPAVCKVKKYRILSAEPIREKTTTVALTGDWHVSPMVSQKQGEFLKSRLAAIRPDVIILQGDMLDSPDGLDDKKLVAQLERELKICSQLAPTVMVLGNHDWCRPIHRHFASLAEFMQHTAPDGVTAKWEALCERAGVKLLRDEWFEVQNVRIFGFNQTPEMYYRPDRRGENLNKMRARFKELKQNGVLAPLDGKINWLAAHAPLQDLVDTHLLDGFDVLSFGHMHGGAVPLGLDDLCDAVGFHGGIYAPFGRWFPRRQARGCETLRSGAKLIVNSGMVLAQNSALAVLKPLNIFKAAEITEVKIQ